MPEPRVIPTEAIAARLPRYSPIPGWHSHGPTGLLPDESCALCRELARRQNATKPPAPEGTGGS